MTVEVSRPRGLAAAFDPVLALRLAELGGDLRLPDPPHLEISDGAAGLWIDGAALRIERGLEAGRPEGEDGAALAERVAATVFRQRWRLVAPVLRAERAGAGRAMRLGCALGLDVEDLRALAAVPAAAAEWAMAGLCPPTARLVLRDPPAAKMCELVRRAAQDEASLVVPALEHEAGPLLAGDQARFRLRRVRGPVMAAEPGSLVSGYASHAGMFLDSPSVVAMLFDLQGAALPEARAVLESASPGSIAAGLRRLLNANMRLPYPHRLWSALLAEPSIGKRPRGRVLLMPGYADGGGSAGAAERMRAALVPVSLLQRAGGPGGVRSVWRLTEGAWRGMDGSAGSVDGLSDAVRPCARAGAVLLVPDGAGWPVHDLLAGDYPALVVAEEREWPPEVGIQDRARITLGRQG